MKLKYWFIGLSVTLALLSALYAANKPQESSTTHAKEVLVRKVGHQLLLSAGDDSSRVLPIKNINGKEFHIKFEHELALAHDSVVNITRSVLGKSNNYNVDVINCAFNETVYSFEIRKTKETSLIPCGGRTLPRSCYWINIRFQEATTSNIMLYGLGGFAISSALLFGFVGLYKRKQAGLTPQTTMANADSIEIGKYLFSHSAHTLELNGVVTVLTSKESKLLNVLCSSINQLMPRETLQKEVWESEGVIVTRSLDMFISKLRKKLEGDPSVKIINHPGRGYKLEVSG